MAFLSVSCHTHTEKSPMSKKQNGEEKTDQEEVAPTVTQGGVMPGGDEMGVNVNAYPRADATRPSTLPRAIADSVGDPTATKGRDRLLALARERNIAGSDTMTRAQLADVLNETMTTEELTDGLDDGMTPEELVESVATD